MSLRIVLVSIITGLFAGAWLFLMLYPSPSLLSFGVCGTLLVMTGLIGQGACDRIRIQERLFGDDT